MAIRGQTKQAQRQRLVKGCCPTHGLRLKQRDPAAEVIHVSCPRILCSFVQEIPRAFYAAPWNGQSHVAL